jgi:hypothetical protein
MRFNLNLAVHQSVHERYALYWAPVVVLGAVAALVYLTSVTARTVREYHRVLGSVKECQAQQGLLRDREQAALRRLQQPEFQHALRLANYVNSLIDRRQLSLTGLTAKLTRLLPADVRLTGLSLSHGSGGPFVRMAIESSNQEKVIAFVQNLEESSDFSEPAITSEDPGQAGEAAAPGGLARVICTARYSGWQDPEAPGEPEAESGDEDKLTLVTPVAGKAAAAPAESSQNSEAGSRKQKSKRADSSQKPPVKSQKPEAGSKRQEVRSKK